VGGFPVEECAAVMIDAARHFVNSKPGSHISKIVFVLFGQRDYDVFTSILAQKVEGWAGCGTDEILLVGCMGVLRDSPRQ